MAYVEHGMWEVLDVLRRAQRGQSQVAISAATGRDRKTVRRYLRAAKELGWERAQGPPDEALAARVLERLRPGPRSVAPVPVERLLHQHLPQIRTWLSEGPDRRGSLTLTKVRKLLHRQGVQVSYSKLYRFCVEHCEFGRHRRATTIFTSNRDVEEWIPLFDDPVLAQSALDRLAHNAHQVTIDGESYRSKQRPGRLDAAAEKPKGRRKS